MANLAQKICLEKNLLAWGFIQEMDFSTNL
jgi:hypothetical protein